MVAWRRAEFTWGGALLGPRGFCFVARALSDRSGELAAKLGVELKLGSPAQAATLLADDCPAWIASAQLAGIKAE